MVVIVLLTFFNYTETISTVSIKRTPTIECYSTLEVSFLQTSTDIDIKTARKTQLQQKILTREEIDETIEFWCNHYSYTNCTKAKAIVRCEGGINPAICNKQFGCNGGMGHFQFIQRTWNNRCMKELDVVDVFDSSQNIQCGVYILQNYGDSDWGTADTWWGSYNCWSS